MSSKFKKGDEVIVISGSDRKKIGKILSIKDKMVLIEGINLATIHKKPTNSSPGEVLKVEKPVHISNISHLEDGCPSKIKYVCPVDNEKLKPFKVKNRVYKKSGKKLV